LAVLADQLLHLPLCQAIGSSRFLRFAWASVVVQVSATPRYPLCLQLLWIFVLSMAFSSPPISLFWLSVHSLGKLYL
jgi:hypothetical protein